MKVLVVGSGGFIGQQVMRRLHSDHYDVLGARKHPGKNDLLIDLNEKNSIEIALANATPEVIINCAGIVENSDKARLNVTFTKNLLEVAQNGGSLEKLIILGSAAEYGEVKPKQLPVSETINPNPISIYGKNKLAETSWALKFGQKHSLPVVIARLFNPIGPHMPTGMLIPQLISQIKEIERGQSDTIKVSHLNSRRDYFDVQDAAQAIALLATRGPKQSIYNIGSGHATSTRELVELVIKNSKLEGSPSIMEVSEEVDRPVASQADITRLKEDFGWTPQIPLRETIRTIMHE